MLKQSIGSRTNSSSIIVSISSSISVSIITLLRGSPKTSVLVKFELF